MGTTPSHSGFLPPPPPRAPTTTITTTTKIISRPHLQGGYKTSIPYTVILGTSVMTEVKNQQRFITINMNLCEKLTSKYQILPPWPVYKTSEKYRKSRWPKYPYDFHTKYLENTKLFPKNIKKGGWPKYEFRQYYNMYSDVRTFITTHLHTQCQEWRYVYLDLGVGRKHFCDPGLFCAEQLLKSVFFFLGCFSYENIFRITKPVIFGLKYGTLSGMFRDTLGHFSCK